MYLLSESTARSTNSTMVAAKAAQRAAAAVTRAQHSKNALSSILREASIGLGIGIGAAYVWYYTIQKPSLDRQVAYHEHIKAEKEG